MGAWSLTSRRDRTAESADSSSSALTRDRRNGIAVQEPSRPEQVMAANATNLVCRKCGSCCEAWGTDPEVCYTSCCYAKSRLVACGSDVPTAQTLLGENEATSKVLDWSYATITRIYK